MAENMTILVVDDDPVILRSTKRVLGEEGHAVEGVLNGEEAMRVLRDNHYDLAFTDLEMPGIDGISLIRLMTQSHAGVAIIVMTGYLLPESMKEAYKLGIISHMIKPFRPAMLKDAAQKAREWLWEHDASNVREEALPASLLRELDAVVQQNRKKPSSIMLALLQAQEIVGYLPFDIQKRIAHGLNVYPSEIHSIVSAYSCFRTKPADDRVSCRFKGSERVEWGIMPKTGRKITDAVNEYINRRN